VLVVGNPNVGKTTLFNRLAGQHARIGNYPGITVERRVGTVKPFEAPPFELVDVPGTYSLAARSAEEQLAISAILGLGDNPRPALCLVVVDAGQLARNLYLCLQLIELGVPVVVAVNMIDEVADNPPNVKALEEWLGVPCVATNARKGLGLVALTRTLAEALDSPPMGRAHVPYPAGLLEDALRIGAEVPAAWLGATHAPGAPGGPAKPALTDATVATSATGVGQTQALALWALSSVDVDDELENIPRGLRERCLSLRAERAGDPTRDLDLEIIGSRYATIDAHLPAVYVRFVTNPPKPKLSGQVDRVLLHPVLGFLSFLVVMLVVFQSLFSWSDPLIHFIESAFGWLATAIRTHVPAGALRDLVTEGVIGGVGNVVVFLPQILMLFFFIGILEDSGYMARVAYLMDRVMKALGLHGRAFVPMLSGFACAVPAILATRTMERQRDRLLTMLVIPLMTCSARLPVYGLIIAALFSPRERVGWIPVQSGLMVGMYLFSLLTTLVATAILGRTVVRARRMPLLIELPPYRLPSLAGTLRVMLERGLDFLKGAGTMILGCTMVLWLLLSYPKVGVGVGVGSVPPAAPGTHGRAPTAETAIEHSFGGRLGKAIEPAIAPLGFDWKLGVGIIGAFAAREVFVSTMGLVYGLGDLDEEAKPLRQRLREERRPDGRPVYTPLVGLSLMVFFALSCQCMSTLAVVRRETRTLRWPLFMFAYMTGLAYLASLVLYQVGHHLGL
jgi:ferrous iron transport protein B